MTAAKLEQAARPDEQMTRADDQEPRPRVQTAAEWAREHLKSAPIRSPEWASRVARIYGLEAEE